MFEEQKFSQRRGRALRDQQLLVWMNEDFDTGFGKVVEDYWRELYHWAYKLLESSCLTYLAEDLRSHRQKLCHLHLQSWLYAIVKQKALECREQRHKMTQLADLLGWEHEREEVAERRVADAIYDPLSRLERWETICEARRTVTALLKNLTDTQREVVVLKYLAHDGTSFGELSYQQIAERLNRPVGTIRSDMSRAMRQLRKRLTQQRGVGGSELQVV